MKTSRGPMLLLGTALAVFLVAGSAWIQYPGLQYDETLFAFASYPQVAWGTEWTVSVFGTPVSLMLMDYLGALKGWLYWAILEGGLPASAAAARIPMLLLGALTLALSFRLINRTFGATTAVVAVWLAATDPTFLFTTRLDWGPVVIQRFCLVAGCLLVLRWYDSPERHSLFWPFFIFGIGIWDKISFYWLLTALAISSLLVCGRELRPFFRPRRIGIALLGLSLGASPALLNRIIAQRNPAPVTVETHVHHYGEKLRALGRTLDGSALQGWISRTTAERPEPVTGVLAATEHLYPPQGLGPSLFLPAMLVSVALLPLSLRSRYRRGILFCLLFCVCAWGQMFAVETAGWIHHAVLVYPAPQLFVSATVVAVASKNAKRARRGAEIAFAALATCLLAASNLASVTHQYGQILRFGGGPQWTEAIYPLHEYLQDHAAGQILIADWGIESQILFLSKNRLPLTRVPIIGDSDDDVSGVVWTLEQWLGQPRTLLVSYSKEMMVFPATMNALCNAAQSNGYHLRLEREIEDRRGRLVFQIWSLAPGPTPSPDRSSPEDAAVSTPCDS